MRDVKTAILFNSKSREKEFKGKEKLIEIGMQSKKNPAYFS